MNKLLGTLALLALSTSAHSAVILFDLQGNAGFGMLGGNEPTPVVGGGSGGEIGSGISFNDVSKVLTINIGWGAANGFTTLTGAATGAHLHGPGSFSQNVGVVVNFLTNGVTAGYTSASYTTNTTANAGSVSGTVTLDATRESQLMSGLLYVNAHTATNGGGEIRGNLVQAPEPTTTVLALLGLAGIAARRRRAA